MDNAYRIRQILDEIEALENEIDDGVKAWSEGEDPFAMAECDPSDQYIKSQEINALKKELKEIVSSIEVD